MKITIENKGFPVGLWAPAGEQDGETLWECESRVIADDAIVEVDVGNYEDIEISNQGERTLMIARGADRDFVRPGQCFTFESEAFTITETEESHARAVERLQSLVWEIDYTLSDMFDRLDDRDAIDGAIRDAVRRWREDGETSPCSES